MKSPTSNCRRERFPLVLSFVSTFLACVTAMVFCRVAAAGDAARAKQSDGAAALAAFETDVRPLLARYCFECHGTADEPMADINLAAFQQGASTLRSRDVWKRVAKALHTRAMPPETARQPEVAERDRLTDWIESMLAMPDPDGRRDPGHIVPRRLNRVEYNFTVQDLFRIPRGFQRSYDPGRGFPTEPIRISRKTTLPIYLPVDDADYGFDNIGEVLTLPPHLMEKYLATAAHIVDVASGTAPENTNTSSRSRELPVRETWVFAAPGADADAHQAAEARLREFLSAAFRRPVSPAEAAPYLRLFDQQYAERPDFQRAMKLPVRAALVSPHFLFRIEGEPGEKPGEIVEVDDYELASRLSYFLWSTMPDRELFRLAEQGKLRDPAVARAQVKRMLGDRRSLALADQFLAQWLQIDGLSGATPDPDMFPQFAEQRGHMLLDYMGDESRLLFDAVMYDDRSVLDLIAADYSYLNAELARHYGVYDAKRHKNPGDRRYVRYDLPDERRGGVLMQASVLTCTSQATRTSPVNRGKWVLEAILGSPPPPPPANVADLAASGRDVAQLPLRKQLEIHRENPNCASCHNRMDPFGLALENYDPIGAWREQDHGQPIDAAAGLPGGATVDGAVALKRYIVQQRRDDFVRCLTEHLLTYALGRKLEYYDAPAVQTIVDDVKQNDYRFSSLVSGIVNSYPFRYRRTEEASND